MEHDLWRSMRRAAARLLLGCGLLPAGLIAPASAHPHVWVTVETTVLFEGGSVTGFRHKWTFDEFYTAMAIEGLDTNKDGVYSREELAELAKVNIEGLKEFNFFTHAVLANETLALLEPKDYWLEHRDAPPDPESIKTPKVQVLPRASEAAKPGIGSRAWDLVFGGGKPAEPEKSKVLTLHFTVPLRQPVLVDAPDFSFAIYDPSFYIAFAMGSANPVKLGEGAPANCRIDIGEAEKGAADAQRLGEAFSQQLGTQNFGLAAAKPIKLACGPKS